MFGIHHACVLILRQKEWKVDRILCFDTFICQIGFDFAHVHVAFYFCWRTQGRRNALHLEPEDGRTKSRETGLSFPWKLIPLPQPITKKTSVSWGGKFCFMETCIVWEKGHTSKDFRKPLLGDQWEIPNIIQVLWKARAGSWDRTDMPMVAPKQLFQRQLGIQASSSHPRTLILVRRCHHSINEDGRHHWRMSSEVSLLREVTCPGPCISGHQLEFPAVWVLPV